MLRFFRQIRQRLITDNKVSKYMFYAIGEILLVVIGILIALQLDNWNERNKEIENLVSILESTKNHIHTEIINGEQEISALKKYLQEMDSAVDIIQHVEEPSERDREIIRKVLTDLPKIGLRFFNIDILRTLSASISDAKLDSDLPIEISRLIRDIEKDAWIADEYMVVNILEFRRSQNPEVLYRNMNGVYFYDFQLMKTDKRFHEYVNASRNYKGSAVINISEILKKYRSLNDQIDQLIQELDH